ncbi:MAG: YoaK family protein [Pseudotabrizicola sp.]|uniref:YoaK family protein n=1 Tax=Pseudotabrizicola sp. TaxID=2939647 RepID=UPI0027266420|nr:YoaK family protein [Pseudotabrizicola sp.]MDO9638367.1 YoaK family protein [Pseudotabrizicola sp.]
MLATLLAAIAGAANAGGFFALGQYTSHMTGYLSQLADTLVIAQFRIAFVSVLAMSAFIAGAGFSTVLINWARQTAMHRQYALPMAVQGAFMLCFSWGGIFTTEPGRLFSLTCLCFIMGMQNATITKISSARIRTTHATGMITDIGIELGRIFFATLRPQSGVRPDFAKLGILLQLVFSFLIGGIIGAVGYSHIGFFFSMPLALILLGLSIPTLLTARPS